MSKHRDDDTNWFLWIWVILLLFVLAGCAGNAALQWKEPPQPRLVEWCETYAGVRECYLITEAELKARMGQ